MTLKKANKRKEKRFLRFRKKLLKDLVKNHRLIFNTVHPGEISAMIKSLYKDIYKNPKKSITRLSKWFNKKTTIYGVSANSVDEMESLESTELYDFCERLAEEEGIVILYDFEEHEEHIPYGAGTSLTALKLQFNYVSSFMLCLKDENEEQHELIDSLSETFDF